MPILNVDTSELENQIEETSQSNNNNNGSQSRNNTSGGGARAALSYEVMSTEKYCLKCYSVAFGTFALSVSFVWISVVLFVCSETDLKNVELMSARLFEIVLGTLAFFAASGLLYGAFVESRAWIVFYFITSTLVLLSFWANLMMSKYVRRTPESTEDTEASLLSMTILFISSSMPILMYMRNLSHLGRHQGDNAFVVPGADSIQYGDGTSSGTFHSRPIHSSARYYRPHRQTRIGMLNTPCMGLIEAMKVAKGLEDEEDEIENEDEIGGNIEKESSKSKSYVNRIKFLKKNSTVMSEKSQVNLENDDDLYKPS